MTQDRRHPSDCAGHHAHREVHPIGALLRYVRRGNPALDTPHAGRLRRRQRIGAGFWSRRSHAIVRETALGWRARPALLHAEPGRTRAGNLEAAGDLMRAPELLLPAGTLEKMRTAYAFGADAVYAGQPRYSLRARNNEFQLEELQTGIQEAHALGKKLFVASNLMPHNAKVKTYMADMEPVIAMRPDALIMADPGLIAMVRERWPEMQVHLSVQANTVNYAAVKFWQSLGLTRVILSRELSLDEIEEIRQQCPDIELEVFIHGALCMAYSGRCLLSGYFNHLDANQGTCTNSCRWDYKVDSAIEDGTGDIQKANPLSNSDGTTSHSTKPASGQVAGYPPQAVERAVAPSPASGRGVGCIVIQV